MKFDGKGFKSRATGSRELALNLSWVNSDWLHNWLNFLLSRNGVKSLFS
jgi:hypothetical protein